MQRGLIQYSHVLIVLSVVNFLCWVYLGWSHRPLCVTSTVGLSGSAVEALCTDSSTVTFGTPKLYEKLKRVKTFSRTVQQDKTCAEGAVPLDESLPTIRPILSEGLIGYKADSLINIRYPEWSLLMQSDPSQGCHRIVNPHMTRKIRYSCLAIVRVESDITYNLQRFEVDSDLRLQMMSDPSIVLNSTGLFNNVANANGRKLLAKKMVKLLPGLPGLEKVMRDKLNARNLPPGADIVVMVVNAGEIDVLANFVCSMAKYHISMSNVVVFAGSADLVPIIESFGAIGMYHDETFAHAPRNASGEYLDRTFIDMMWYKSFSVWLLLKLKYNVLFQDIDLVWFRSPFSFFRKTHDEYSYTKSSLSFTDSLMSFVKTGGRTSAIEELEQKHNKQVDSSGFQNLMHHPPDAYLSDDGQRSLRYTPFYANSGFYYLFANERTEYFAWSILTAFDLLHITGSHQNVFTVKLMEGLDFSGLRPKLMTLRDFPSGVKFNHDKPFMRAIADGHEKPYMFHM